MPVRLSIFTRYAIRSLAANRTRTFVTAVGVALACALLASALVLAGSLRAGIVAGEEASEGAWQVGFSQMGEDQLARIEEELGPSLAARRDLGAALTEDPDVPLLNVVTTLSGDKGLVVEPSLADGRWPEAPGELAVPSRWAETWPVGSTVELSLGRRRSTDDYACPYDYPPSYELDETGEVRLAETLEDVGEARAFVVVGIVDGDADVAYACPEEPAAGPEPLVFAWAAPDLATTELEPIAEGICEQGGYCFWHYYLLEGLGLSENRTLDASFGLVCACAAAVASLVTVTLISGTFRVSLAERVRQFGLLSSAGASRRQLVRVVLVEATLLCATGIPAGLVLGVALDAVALSIAADGTSWVTGGVPVALVIRPGALLAAATVSAASVLLSALAPALRASRPPAVEAMREGGGNARARRSRPFAGTLLPRRAARGTDVPALLSSRFRRTGRVRGRATVVALAVSVALLVGGGVLGSYFGTASVLEGTPADVSAYVSAEGTAAAPGAEGELPYLPALLERLHALPGIREAGFVSKTQVLLDFDDSSVATWAEEMLWRPEGDLLGSPSSQGGIFGSVYYVDDATWALLLEEVGAGKEAPGCLIVNAVTVSERAGQRPFADAILGTRLSLSGTEASWEVVGLLDDAPEWFWLSRGELESVLPTVLAPASSVAGISQDDMGYGMTTLYATAEDSAAAVADVERLLEEDSALAAWDGVVDEQAEARRSETLFAAVRALLSTFGVAAAAVGVASAFNSTAASVLLRAHDFAVLRSVGMGERDLRRMLALECARTATLALALGLAAALALGAWLSAQGGLTVRSLGLSVPWTHVAGAVAMVALALLASCAHALRRLRATSLIDALRAE